MSQTALVLPMAAMVLLTFIVAGNTLRVRIAAVRAGQVRLSRFRAQQGDPPPERVAVAERAFQNMMEVPPLFFAACITAMVLGITDTVTVALAWAYVGLRVVHMAIFLGGNNVRHRMRAYLASCAVLLIIWARLALAAV